MPNPDLRTVTVTRPGKCRRCMGLGRVNVTYDAAVDAWEGDDCPDCDGKQTAKGIHHD